MRVRVRVRVQKFLQTLSPVEALLLGLILAGWIGSLMLQVMTLQIRIFL